MQQDSDHEIMNMHAEGSDPVVESPLKDMDLSVLVHSRLSGTKVSFNKQVHAPSL